MTAPKLEKGIGSPRRRENVGTKSTLKAHNLMNLMFSEDE
jgi:hypothetical protein